MWLHRHSRGGTITVFPIKNKYSTSRVSHLRAPFLVHYFPFGFRILIFCVTSRSPRPSSSIPGLTCRSPRPSSSKPFRTFRPRSQIYLRSAHRCGLACHGDHHAHLVRSNDQVGSVNDHHKMRSGSYSADTPPAALGDPVHRPRIGNGSDLGLSGDGGGATSPGGRHRKARQHDGYFRGDHYCRVRVGRKGAPSDGVEVRG